MAKAATSTAQTATTMKQAFTSCVCSLRQENNEKIASRVAAREISSCQPNRATLSYNLKGEGFTKKLQERAIDINVKRRKVK
jgi:hypothetical protein